MEMCEDIFEKHCVIEYKKRAEDEEVEICNEVFDRTCEEPGPEVCEPVFESECKTSYHVHEVEEDKPNCVIMQVLFRVERIETQSERSDFYCLFFISGGKM